MKKETNASKEAESGASFAKFFFRPGGRQAGTLLLTLGIPRNDRNSPKPPMNPGTQTQAPRGGI
jgi:hypothetical protein